MRRSFILICVALLLSVFANAQSYQITVNITGNGNVTYNDAAVQNADVITVDENATPAFTIAPETGNRLVSVMLDGENVAESLVEGVYTFAAVTADHILDVTFEAITYTITATAGEGGTITPSGVQTVNEGADQSFTIAASEHYNLVSVIVDGETNVTEALENGVYTFTNVTSNHTIAATFEAITYTITATAGEGGSITPSGAQTVNEGADQSFTIAASEHYNLVSVIVDGETNVTEALENGVYTFTNVTANHTIAATFEAITYTITATAGEGGSITPSGAQTVNEGADQSFTIAANEGYRIASVIVDAETNVTTQLVEGVYTFTAVAADHTIAATFEAIPVNTYTITASASEGGSITPEGVVVVNAGTDATFTILANEGYRLVSVIVDANTENEEDVTGQCTGSLIEPAYTFRNVNANHTIHATFEAIPATIYTITATAGANGSINPAGEVTVEEGENAEFTIAANEGYRIASVIVDAETEGETNVTTLLDENGVYTFEAVTANHTIAATFEADETPTTYTITFTIGEHGSVTYNDEAVTTSVTVNENATPSFTITPETGYRVASAIIDEGVEGEEEDVTDAIEDDIYTFEAVTANHTMHITFEENTTPNTHTVTLTIGEHGTIVATDDEDNQVTIEDGVITVNHGDDLYLEITPEEGYKIEELIVNENPYDLENDELLGLELPMLDITSDMTVSVTFEENSVTPEVGPYFEFVNLAENYQVGDSVEFGIKVHSNGSVDNLCSVEYKMSYSSNAGQSYMNLSDLSRYGIFSYDVRGEGTNVITVPITRGSGTFSSDVDYHGSTYSISAYTLGLFDNDCVDRNRPVDFDMLFTKSGMYKFKITLNTCSNPGETLGSTFVATNCDGMTHYDRYANTCANKTVYKEYEFIMDVEGANVCTVTTSVPAGHGTISPEGTTVVTAGQDLELTFTPDENYELDSLFVNGIMTYPTLDGSESVVDNRYTLTNIRSNQKVVAKFRDVRPYYNIHVEIETAGGTVTPSDTTVVVGSDVTLNIRPNAGFHISQLEIDGNIVIDYASSEIVFTNINSDHHIKISFFPNSVEENMFANLSIYPNPNNGQFTVSSDDFDGDVTFQIFSVSGAIMEEMSVNGEKSVSINKALPAGTYFLRIIAGDKVATRKVVVE